jgi:hypothetical protein
MVKNYVSPACTVLEFEYEGVLCLSGTNGQFVHQGITGDDREIF